MFSVFKMDAGLLSRTAWMSAMAYFAVNSIGPLMEKYLPFSITVIKGIGLRVQHPSSQVLGTLGAPGELCLPHGPRGGGKLPLLRNQGKESPRAALPRDASRPHRWRGSGKPLPDATGFGTQILGFVAPPWDTRPGSPCLLLPGPSCPPCRLVAPPPNQAQVWECQEELRCLGRVNGVVAWLCIAI